MLIRIIYFYIKISLRASNPEGHPRSFQFSFCFSSCSIQYFSARIINSSATEICRSDSSLLAIYHNRWHGESLLPVRFSFPFLLETLMFSHKTLYEFLIIFLNLFKCPYILILQAIRAFLLSADTYVSSRFFTFLHGQSW